MSSAICFNLDQSQCCRLVMGLTRNSVNTVIHNSLVLKLYSIYTHFNTLAKSLRKTLWKKVKLLKMSNFIFYHDVSYAICILKSFNSHISVAVCKFFKFGTVSKWCVREWVKLVEKGI